MIGSLLIALGTGASAWAGGSVDVPSSTGLIRQKADSHVEVTRDRRGLVMMILIPREVGWPRGFVLPAGVDPRALILRFEDDRRISISLDLPGEPVAVTMPVRGARADGFAFEDGWLFLETHGRGPVMRRAVESLKIIHHDRRQPFAQFMSAGAVAGIALHQHAGLDPSGWTAVAAAAVVTGAVACDVFLSAERHAVVTLGRGRLAPPRD